MNKGAVQICVMPHSPPQDETTQGCYRRRIKILKIPPHLRFLERCLEVFSLLGPPTAQLWENTF